MISVIAAESLRAGRAKARKAVRRDAFVQEQLDRFARPARLARRAAVPRSPCCRSPRASPARRIFRQVAHMRVNKWPISPARPACARCRAGARAEAQSGLPADRNRKAKHPYDDSTAKAPKRQAIIRHGDTQVTETTNNSVIAGPPGPRFARPEDKLKVSAIGKHRTTRRASQQSVHGWPARWPAMTPWGTRLRDLCVSAVNPLFWRLGGSICAAHALEHRGDDFVLRRFVQIGMHRQADAPYCPASR